MAHKVKIKRQRLVLTNDEQIEDLLDQPLFVNFDRFTTIGIYPVRYDLTQSPDKPVVGFYYHCYRINKHFGTRKTVKFDEIPDFSFFTLSKEDLEGERSDLIELILLKEGYNHTIAESEFLDILTSTISDLLPSNRVHAQFQKRTHD